MTATLIVVGAAVAAMWLLRALFFPYGPCPVCRGRRGRGIGSTRAAWSHCRACGGSGELLRLSARIWPQHRRRD